MPDTLDKLDPQQLLRDEIDAFGRDDALSVASTQISNLTRKRVGDLLSRFSTTGLSRTGITGAALSDVYAGANEALGSAAVRADEMKSRRRMEIIRMLLGQQRFEESQPGFGDFMGKLLSAGAQVGSAALLASDRRLKENIVYTGDKTKDGIPIVEFDYKGKPGRFRGHIAQDVMKIKPEAVIDVKYIDYNKLSDGVFERID